jgi:hypothetical protein
LWKLACAISRLVLTSLTQISMATDKGPVRTLCFSLGRSPVTISGGCMSPALLLGHSVDAICSALHHTCGLQSYHFTMPSLAPPMPIAIQCLSDTTRLQATSQRRAAGTCIVVPKLLSGPPRSTCSRFWARFGRVVELHDQHAQLDTSRQALSSDVSNNSGLQLTTQGSAKPCPM